ncbi:MAG: glycerophosphoryl diester phosphodiesterase [Actinomycetaceae bacterium]|nr:glycerophosphoryl diester phosphodiesterase [Actinomycetaceae bacterium]
MTDQTPLIFAHRGLNRVAPENTMAAFRAAYNAGVQWLEIDVDILGDGTAIIIHDSTLNRTTNLTGSYNELTSDDLTRIDAGSWFSPDFVGEPLPTLRAVVDFANVTGVNLNIEVKANTAGAAATRRLVDTVVAEIGRLKHSRVILSSFSLLTLELLRQRAPKIPRACLFEEHTLGEDWRSIAELLEVTFIHPDDAGLTENTVRQIRTAGYGVNVWTVNDRERAQTLFNWGATGVFTDVADQFLAPGTFVMPDDFGTPSAPGAPGTFVMPGAGK